MRKGFTLVELLVVVAVIAMLVGLLLPSIGKSRQNAQQIICLSNVKQIALATTAYADDHKEQVWPHMQWARLPDNVSGTEPGLLYDYVSKADKIGECPINKRRGRNGREANDGDGGNVFGGSTWLDFDYCMVTNSQGAMLSTDIAAGFVPPNMTPRRILDASQAAQLTPLRGLPIFVEESTWWYNDGIQDGLWGNEDQITTRHFGGGHMTFLDGSVQMFRGTQGPRGEEFREGNDDFEANDIFVSVKRDALSWYKLYRPAGYQYGWVNRPR